MARLLWTGLGAVGAALALRRAQQVAHRFTPEGVAEQVEETGKRARGALEEAVVVFRSARAQREKDLVAALLVQPDGGDPSAVFRRPGRRTTADEEYAGFEDDGDDDTRASRSSRARRTTPSGRVDKDEPLYDF